MCIRDRFSFPHRRHCNFSYFFCEKIGENVEFKFCNPQKALPCVKPRHTRHGALKSVQSFFSVEDGKKKKGRHKKSCKRYISLIRGEAPREWIFTKFCTSGDVLDVIACASFDVEKLKGLGNTRGQIVEFPIETAGHPYNSAALPRSLWLYPPKAHFSEDHISAPEGCCATKFLHALENDQVLLAHPPPGTGAPLQFFERGIKNCLKMLRTKL